MCFIVTSFRGKPFGVSPLRMTFALDYFIDAFYQVEEILFYSCWDVLSGKNVLDIVKWFFCVYWDDCVVFLSYFIHIMNYIKFWIWNQNCILINLLRYTLHTRIYTHFKWTVPWVFQIYFNVFLISNHFRIFLFRILLLPPNRLHNFLQLSLHCQPLPSAVFDGIAITIDSLS